MVFAHMLRAAARPIGQSGVMIQRPIAGRPVAPSVDELLAGAGPRRPMQTADSKSGARMERVTIDGQPHVVKYLHVDDDWIMRSSGDVGCRPLQVWRSGLLDLVPDCIDHAVVGAASGLGRNGWGAALLMRDVSDWLVPEGDDAVPLDQHLGFLDHMAALHSDVLGLVRRPRADAIPAPLPRVQSGEHGAGSGEGLARRGAPADRGGLETVRRGGWQHR